MEKNRKEENDGQFELKRAPNRKKLIPVKTTFKYQERQRMREQEEETEWSGGRAEESAQGGKEKRKETNKQTNKRTKKN